MYKLMIICCLVILLLLSACAPGLNDRSPERPAGFFWGIWHGWIAPVSLILSLFVSEVSIYEVNNTGFWYDLGFYLAVVGGFGSLAYSRRKKKS
ncbi:MAG: hypothetical protein CVU50_01125 [Candidatus Cloacimonetes bacterium HGW-Cloacimonetes-3]|jgi:hypothetical protein|nr:MAG: hypothetical protein CVU50_01125 [Candidatus Cloacimonetes bacterium HGW-Cloacimonetes-3]